MLQKLSRICLVFLVTTLIAVIPVAAAINTINQGDTVFIGESGLDITGAVGASTQIGWWAPGAVAYPNNPSKVADIATQTSNFYVSPTQFRGYTGNWYRLQINAANGIAFIVADPSLSIRAEDVSYNFDVTDKWAPTGDQVGFSIETNLAGMNQRGVPGAPITINFQSPDGATYTSVVNAAGTATNLVDIPVSVTPYDTGAIWDTGNNRYAPGTYVIWAECNANNMMDNYEIPGTTISEKITVLVQEQNPQISLIVPTISTPTKQITPAGSPSLNPVTTTLKPTTGATPNATTPLQTTVMVTTLPAPILTTSPGYSAIASMIATLLVIGILLIRKH